MKESKRIFVSALLVALLAGCGGGGGGGGDGAGLAPLALDQDNAMQVAAAVVDAVALVEGLGAGGVVPPVPAAAAAANDVAAAPPVLTAIIREQLGHFQLLAPAADFRIAAVVIPPTSFECLPGVPENGTFTISGEVADETGTVLTPGDTLSISFNNCDYGDGVVFNGKMAFVVVTGVDFDFTPPYDYTVDATLTNFSITESGETFTASGDLTLREATDDGLFIETWASGGRLSAKLDGQVETLVDYWLYGTLDLAAEDAYTADSGGRSDCCATLESTFVGGAVDFENLQAFAGIGDNYPYEGILYIIGAIAAEGVGESTIEMSVVDETCVSLAVDSDGDGAGDVTIMTSWESLSTGIPDDCVI